MTSQTRKQIITIQIMPNISINKDDKTKSKLSISMAQQSEMLHSLFLYHPSGGLSKCIKANRY